MSEKINEEKNEERKIILTMLKEDQINVEEAERLIEALEDEEEILETKKADKKTTSRKIRILCEVKGKNKVNVKLPLSVIPFGLGIAKKFISKTNEHYDTIQDIDLDEIFFKIEEENATFPYKLLDINDEESESKVELYIE